MIHRDAYTDATMPPMKPPFVIRSGFRSLWRFLAVEPCAKSRTELTLFDITRMIEAHSIRQMFIHLLQPLKSAREQRLVPMNRRPRTDNQLEFADSLQCLKHLSPERIHSRVCLSVWIDRIDNLADDKLIETLKRMDHVLIVVDDLEATKAFFIELGLT